ncbi:DUF4240 domain-containing protein [Spirilliplanes yamanashiensis]|uniref:DUF4240 domain-containing protein n=1 Tax=Spirilliplanes yamanashiensis TaxID=42233 RepID=UPI00194DFEA0|nr:DUF4240 domain-containing protein [Spirilliplanes yamanashiensis]MDP9818350.1 hypothetical protein [Spirilliplanes yamanashiensis]
MIDDDAFWALIGTLGRDPDDDDFTRLTDRLANRSAEDITGFADQLALALYALDTPAHFAAVRPFVAGDDSFLYVRCAAVAAGRKAYEKAAGQPKSLERFGDRDAEPLLTVAPEAFERATGMLWEHETPVSYEMGSNASAWGAVLVPAEPDLPRSWLTMMCGWGLGDWPPPAYGQLLDHVMQALAHDPAWERWWSAAGVPECELSLIHDRSGFPTPGTTFKKGRKRIAAEFVRNPAPFTSDDPTDLLPHAVDEVVSMLAAVRDRFDLPPLPPVDLPPLPADIGRGFAEEEPLPPLPPELFKRVTRQGGLKPESIAAYYRHNPNAEGADFWLRHLPSLTEIPDPDQHAGG